MRRLALALLCVVLPLSAQAQQHDTIVVRAQLPRDVAVEVVSLFNATTTLRTTERTDIEAGREVVGDVAVLDGPLTIAGHITGRVLAINSDVILARGARIDGDLLVVGGEVEGSEGAVIGGELRIYHAPLRYTQQGDQLVASLDETSVVEPWWRRFERRGRNNFNRLEIASAGVYNRVEGLPVRMGPVLYRDQGWGHFRLDATAVVRTESSFASSTPDVGHDVRFEARAGRQFGASVGGRIFDIVDGVESWQLSNAEVALASFFFHRDYRDYYGRHGGQLFAALRATENADLTLSYSDERWRARETRDPFAFALNGVGWRENPQLDAGRFHLANLTLRVDTRNDEVHPRDGWYLLADYERGAGRIDVAGPTSPNARLNGAGTTRYHRFFLDARRYNRIAPNAQLNMRLVTGGWLSGDPLPLERRLSIDGPGTVPGFDFRSVQRGGIDVGTCSEVAAPPGRPAQCERVGLAQLEYRNDLHVSMSRGSGAQRRVQLDVGVPSQATPVVVTATGLFGDPDMRELVRSGFPASLKYRIELWRSGGLFNDLEGTQEWELIVQYDPTGQRYRVVRRQAGRLEDLGSFATLSTAQAVLERPLKISLSPQRQARRYYYNFVLDVSALSVSDMDQLERWLRGVRGGTAAGAIGSGMRTLMLRMLGGENRHYERRSATFLN